MSGGYKTYSTVQKDQNAQKNPTTPANSCCESSKPASTTCCGAPANVNDRGEVASTQEVVQLDACGLQCPGPIMQVFNKMKFLQDGQVLEVKATDPGFISDIPVWCERTGNKLLRTEKTNNYFLACIQKGNTAKSAAQVSAQPANLPQDKTIVVFSGDLDKALASFIIANGAASMGRKVTLFFTFWGLNVLRKPKKVSVKKGFLDKMFGMMMPRGTKKLGLSNMQMMGMGPKMIRFVMKNKGVDSLEALMAQARMAGVRIVACQMSMDVMGLTKEELLDGVEVGGVATYLGAAEESNVNLFI